MYKLTVFDRHNRVGCPYGIVRLERFDSSMA